MVGIVDFGMLLGAWGTCSSTAAAQPPSMRNDLLAVKAAWGKRGARPATDLNADGRVDVRDWLQALAE